MVKKILDCPSIIHRMQEERQKASEGGGGHLLGILMFVVYKVVSLFRTIVLSVLCNQILLKCSLNVTFYNR